MFPLNFSEEESCNISAATPSQIHSTLRSDNGNSNALCEGEKEEKSESETESLADFLHTQNEAGFHLSHKEYYNPFFGTKALYGNQHLYDLFHAWKIHLS